MPKISVIMPVYNGAKYLKKSLESISNQTFTDVEVICVDDGSTDNSLEVLNDLKEKYDFIRVIEQENQGSGKARNTGMENAIGEYIAFLDADDIFIDEDALDTMYDVAKVNDADIVSANLQFVKKDYSIKENHHYERGDYVCFDEFDTISPDDYGIPYAFYKNIFKRKFLIDNDIIFPDLLRGQDPVFLAKAFTHTKEIYTCPVDLYGYNYSVGGGVNNKMNNYQKKKSYIMHFRDACDELQDGGLLKTSKEYKLHMTRYLNWKKNNQDEDLFRIYGELFDKPEEYFDTSDKNYIIFNAAARSYLLYHSDDENLFTKVKKSMEGIDAEKLPKAVRQKHSLIIDSSTLDDYKDRYYDFTIEKLEKRNKYLKNKIDELTSENEALEDELKDLDVKVDSVKSSKGFKIAKKVKNIIK